MRVIGIIPARYQSTRLPGKPLTLIMGKPMIQHVFERAARSASLQKVVVATDDTRIFDTVRDFGGEAVMTGQHHPSGTDRLAEAGEKLALAADDIVVNIQGDEPLVRPEMVDALTKALIRAEGCPLATLAYASTNAADFRDPNVVKLVMDQTGRALYFSRSPIPFFRDAPGNAPFRDASASTPRTEASPGSAAAANRIHHSLRTAKLCFLRHLGYYAYRQSFLQTFTRLPPTPLETAEKLEQLRALEHGYSIQVALSPWETIGVDTPADLEKVSRILREIPNP